MAEQQLTNLQKLEIEKQVAAEKKKLENSLISYEKMSEISGLKTEMIQIIHRTVAKNTTIPELAYFLALSKSSGLNPLNKEIWCYKDSKDNLIIFTGRDGFLKSNKQNPMYRGMRSSEVCENDEFEIDMIEGHVKHKLNNKDRGKVVGAYCIVSIEGIKDIIKWLDFAEFDLGQAKWKSAPKMMIKKCAESHALKEAAGITGIQAEEAFIVRDGVAVSAGEEKQSEVVDQDFKEKERLLKMIEASTTIDGLSSLSQYCTFPEAIEAYDKKFKELDDH